MKKSSQADLDGAAECAVAMAQATIQGAMTEAGLSQRDVAGRLGQSHSTVSRMLSGRNITLRSLARVAAACGYELRFRKVRAT